MCLVERKGTEEKKSFRRKENIGKGIQGRY